MDKREVLKDTETLYNGKILTLKRLTVQLPDGTEAAREVVHTNGSAGVLAVQQHRALFVQQWRSTIDQMTLEIPAGKCEVAEAPLVTAQRELNEEAGLAADHWQPLTTFYQSIGFSDAKISVFMATELRSLATKRPLDQGEFLDAHWLTLQEAQAAQQQGLICDSKTVMALSLWQMAEEKDGRG
ncbi:NUDIX hydrolase [Lacticaseibacillus saniviri]|uniref:NUDIX hydrolase n=1 Tax=Lacticaseibacillus saniviri JCM 17471 = DSM 24301 TaxID=1293598 RepID=A0A0R2N2V4_9LACO|nr:NUDIX hydrolase [Lacticaseibacillus saniviri]KRO18365.1 NUDIX hydrolase [Lacticaseibacillus saniviri JCM 17471 = DSM 24301]MCG4282183.1 NUDIX hydrolase [Lacticaseibacillus saniviri]